MVFGNVAIGIENFERPMLCTALFRVCNEREEPYGGRDQNLDVTFNRHDRREYQQADHSVHT